MLLVDDGEISKSPRAKVIYDKRLQKSTQVGKQSDNSISAISRRQSSEREGKSRDQEISIERRRREDPRGGVRCDGSPVPI